MPRATKTLDTHGVPPAPHAGAPEDAGVRVLCVDDHAILIEGLKAQFSIENRIRIVGRLASPEKLIDEVARLHPDVVLLDIEMPGPDVFEMADRLRHFHPHIRMIFLSAHVRDVFISSAYRCGAAGYFAKGDDLEDIVRGIQEVVRAGNGSFVMGPKVRARCAVAPERSVAARAEPAARPATALQSLTPRELEVLRLIGKGRSRNEIAAELCRSAKTIDGHQERMMRKLNIESRADLMRFAIREGLAEV